MEPVLRPQPRLLSLDDELLLSMTRANFLSQITVSSPSRGWEREFRPPSCAQNELMSRVQVLSLHGNSLNRMKELCGLTELRHLDISFNKFTRLDDISHMVRGVKENVAGFCGRYHQSVAASTCDAF